MSFLSRIAQRGMVKGYAAPQLTPKPSARNVSRTSLWAMPEMADGEASEAANQPAAVEDEEGAELVTARRETASEPTPLEPEPDGESDVSLARTPSFRMREETDTEESSPPAARLESDQDVEEPEEATEPELSQASRTFAQRRTRSESESEDLSQASRFESEADAPDEALPQEPVESDVQALRALPQANARANEPAGSQPSLGGLPASAPEASPAAVHEPAAGATPAIAVGESTDPLGFHQLEAGPSASPEPPAERPQVVIDQLDVIIHEPATESKAPSSSSVRRALRSRYLRRL